MAGGHGAPQTANGGGDAQQHHHHLVGVSMAEDMDLFQALAAGGGDDGLGGLGGYGALSGLVGGMTSKFDEEYGMFTNDDVYFGA
jgi:hypothetical protein